jgi:L-asparagine oxygenase
MQAVRRLSIDPNANAQMKKLLYMAGSPYADFEDFLVSLAMVSAQLPKQVVRELQEFRTNPRSPGILLLDGLPIDDVIPDTPANARRSMDKTSYISEGSLLSVAKLLGEPYGYLEEKNGEIIQNLAPVQAEASSTSSESSGIDLGFHTDLDFDKQDPHSHWNVTNPDFIVLLCLRQDPEHEANTLYADARDICGSLSVSQIEVLRQPLFEFGAAYTFTGQSGDKKVWSLPTSVIQGPDEFPEITVELACGVRGISEEANMVLSELSALLGDSDFVQGACLSAGQMLLINNRKGAHARTEFTARFDGQDRWLHRLYVRQSLWNLRNGRSDHMRLF